MKALSITLKAIAASLALLSFVLFALQATFPGTLVGTGFAYLLWFTVALTACLSFALAFSDKPRMAAFCAGVTTAAFALGEIAHDIALGVMLKGGSDFVLVEGGGDFVLISLGLGCCAATAAFLWARRLGRSS